MCGIFCTVSSTCADRAAKCQELKELIQPNIMRRGPDHLGITSIDTITSYPKKCSSTLEPQEEHEKLSVCFACSVLHLRGDIIAKQPVQDNFGNILAWNGEIFGGLHIPDGESDTLVLLNRLSDGTRERDIIETFSLIEGPWAFVYYQAKYRCLWFGRDYFGRRSLLWHIPKRADDIFSLSSVGRRNDFYEEVPADGIYCLDLKSSKSFLSDGMEFPTALTKYAWQNDNGIVSHSPQRGLKCPVENRFNKDVPDTTEDTISWTTNDFHATTYELTKPEQIDTQTSASSSTSSIGRESVLENQENSSVETDLKHKVSIERAKREVIQQFLVILKQAVYKRVHNLPRRTTAETQDPTLKSNEKDNAEKRHSNVGVLFSGGLDSIVLAALADRCLPENEAIDLINVAFAKKEPIPPIKNRKHKSQREELKQSYEVPDRITGRSGLAELETLNPRRRWNFVEVNVTAEELQDSRSHIITHLVSPLQTVLDDSIGCAIWFAAKGEGTLLCKYRADTSVNNSSMYVPYTSPARVLLVGMGADEQLGGYARHRSRFNKEGWQGLLLEIEMEVQRISQRNLGRDDRCISDHGREGRYPFLDEHVVSFLNNLPVWLKCDLRLDRGVGEKILLRQVAKLLGLTKSSDLPKRAIQFGSRIAKLEKQGEKGSEICNRL